MHIKLTNSGAFGLQQSIDREIHTRDYAQGAKMIQQCKNRERARMARVCIAREEQGILHCARSRRLDCRFGQVPERSLCRVAYFEHSILISDVVGVQIYIYLSGSDLVSPPWLNHHRSQSYKSWARIPRFVGYELEGSGGCGSNGLGFEMLGDT